MSERVGGKVALVTGAARGIGLATAQLLCREGATVYIGDLLDEQGEAEAAALRDGGGRAHYVHLDVSDPGAWERVIEQIRRDEQRLDVLVNNAGIVTPLTSISAMSLDDWRKISAVNYDGVFLGMKTALPLMRSSGGGSIVNMASTAGYLPVEWTPAYSATKAAVINLTKSVALQCGSAQDGVRVNAVLPGIIDTPIITPERKADIADRARRVVPLKRQGQPIDIAQGVLWLASDDSSYVTGISLVIDGGLSSRFPIIPPDSYTPA
jgi:NAD(P)-dependent dehydrogenase (short-subunit alcohol dehydrogenase family)